MIANELGIHFLFTHLLSEFTSENLLFFIEAIQWLYAVTKKEWHRFDTGELGDVSFVISETVPLSSINREAEENWFFGIAKLYEKYVDPNSKLEINLPHHIKVE